MSLSLQRVTSKVHTGHSGRCQGSGSSVSDQACASCRDFIMTAFNMTEDQAITAITVGIDFSVSQVTWQRPRTFIVRHWKDHQDRCATTPLLCLVCGLANRLRRVSYGESAA